MLAPALEAPLGALLSAPVVGAGAIADAVVVGAGPAGSLAARALAARGASVLLVERAAFPRWKVCGACLNAGAQAALARAGLADLPRRLGAVPLERLRLAARAGSATLALRGSVALSREALDAALAKAAVEAGAELLTGARASRAEAADGLEEVVLAHAGATSRARARLIVDATGLSGGLVSGGPAAAERAPMERTEGSRVGLGARFDGAAHPVRRGELLMAIATSGYAGVVRVEDGTLVVAAAVDAEALRALGPAELVARILGEARVPALRGDPFRGWRGTPPLTCRAPAAARGRYLLRVGDAAGYVEPFTGEGMYWALAGGLGAAALAAEALRAGAPTPGRRAPSARAPAAGELAARWSAAHRALVRRRQRLCRALARGLRSPRLVSAAVAGLAVAPRLASPLVRRAARARTPEAALP